MVLLRSFVSTVAAVALLAVVAIVFLTGTKAGTRWLLQAAVELSGGSLAVEEASGSLLGGLDVGRLEVRTPAAGVEVMDAGLRLHWPDLLRRQVTLKTVTAAELSVTITPDPDAPAGDGGAVELPVAIAADDLRIGRVRIDAGTGEPVILDDLRFAGRFAQGVLEYAALEAGLYGAVVAATAGRFDTAQPYALSADVRWSFPGLDVHGDGRVGGSLGELTVGQQVRLAAEASGEIAVDGTLKLLDGPPSFTASARWESVQREVPGLGVVTAAGGRLEVSGSVDAYRANLSTGLRLPGMALPEAHLRMAARGDTGRVDFDGIGLQAFDGTIDGSGTLVFADGVSGSFRMTGSDLDPGHYDRRLAGSVAFAGNVGFDAGGNFTAVLEDVHGELAGRPLKASGTVSRRQGVLEAKGIRVAAGDNRLDLDGRWAARIEGRFRVSAPELHVLWPDSSGSLEGEGTFGGTPQRPSGSARIEGSNLAYAGMAMAGLRLDGALTANDRLDVTLSADGVVAGGQQVGDLDFTVRGPFDGFATRLRLDGGPVTAALDGTAGWEGRSFARSFRYTMEDGTVELPGEYVWQLREPASFVVGNGDFRVGAHCWTAGDATLCLEDSRLAGDTFEAGGTLNDLPLAMIAALLGDGFAFSGVLNAEVSLQRGAAGLAGFLDAQTRDAEVIYRTLDGDSLGDTIEILRVRVDAAGDEVSYEAQFADSFGITLSAGGQIRDPLGAEPSIAGTVEGGAPDLGRLSPMLEGFVDVGDVAGALELRAKLAGRLREPDFSGGLTLSEGRLSVPAAGIKVENVELVVEGRADGNATVRGHASSGSGKVELRGELLWSDGLVPVGNVAVTGERFELVNLPDGRVQVSPDIRVAFTDRRFRVSGRLLVPQAAITLSEIADSGVAVSPDVVVHGREAESGAARQQLFVLDDVEVVLGEQVSFSGFGLSTQLAGRIVLDQAGADDPAAVPAAITGDGVVRVTSGSFRALGQELDIERGSLIFSGALTEPAIDVRAVREVTYEGRDVKVGLLLSGNIARIQSVVFSEPAMGEMDALSYLTTGRPLSAAGSGDQLSVTNAALTLGLRGALPVAERLGSALGVDEVGLSGGADADDTELTIGEHIGKDLFLRYSYGIFNQVGTIKATYRLSRRLSIEGSSGEVQALDLLYSVTW